MLLATKTLLGLYPNLNTPSVKIKLLEETKKAVISMPEGTHYDLLDIYANVLSAYLKQSRVKHKKLKHFVGDYKNEVDLTIISTINIMYIRRNFKTKMYYICAFEAKEELIRCIDKLVYNLQSYNPSIHVTQPVMIRNIKALCKTIPLLNQHTSKIELLDLMLNQTPCDLNIRAGVAFNLFMYLHASFNTHLYIDGVDGTYILELLDINKHRFVSDFNTTPLSDIDYWTNEEYIEDQNKYLKQRVKELHPTELNI